MDAKSVVEISKRLIRLRGCAGSVAKLNVGILRRSFSQKRLVTERVGKHQFTTVIREIHSSSFAGFILRNLGSDDRLYSLCLTCRFKSVDEVFVVSRVAVMQSDESDSQSVGVVAAASSETETTGNRRDYGQLKL